MSTKTNQAERSLHIGAGVPAAPHATIEWPTDWNPDEGWPDTGLARSPDGRTWGELDAALKAHGSSLAERVARMKGGE
jgi:hypothetical protein